MSVRGLLRLVARGPIPLWEEVRHRAYRWHFERKLGIATHGIFEQSELGYAYKDGKLSSPIGYEHVFWALDRIPFPAHEVEMVDFGSGLGRAVAAAAMRPFKSVTGIELSNMLAERAQRNLAAMRHRQAKDVRIVQGNVLDFEIPATTNVFYLFNPFDGETLSRTVAKIRDSLAAHPRRAFVIFFNHKHMDREVEGQTWIRKVYDGQFYPQYGCGLYEAEAPAAAQRQAASA